MGYKSLIFLSKEYEVSEAVNDFLSYDELLTPIRGRIITALSQDIKKDAKSLTFEDDTPNYVENVTSKYKRFMLECAEI